MHFRNRLMAGALAFMMAVSSLQFPAGNVRAEETAEETKEVETFTEETDSGEEYVSESAIGTEERIETVESIEEKETQKVSVETELYTQTEVETDIPESETQVQEEITDTESTESQEKTGVGDKETGTQETEPETIKTTDESFVIEESESETEKSDDTELINVSEDEDEYYEVIASGVANQINWKIVDSGTLIVTGTGDFSDSKESNRAPWYEYREKIERIRVDVTGMTDASYMFYGCNVVRVIDISGFDTSQVTDMSYMFAGCEYLSSLNISNFNTSQVTDMSYMFANCEDLYSLDFSSFNTSQVTDMSYMLAGCWAIRKLDLRSFDTSNVKNMRNMFSSCGVEDIKLKGFNTSQVTDMSYMFANCEYLYSLDFSSFNTSQVTDMSHMFEGCSQLYELDLSSFNTSQVTDMSYMFANCDEEGFGGYPIALSSLKLSNFNTGKVTNMSNMFAGCNKLTSLSLDNFDTSQVTDMSRMFAYCYDLESLDLSHFNAEKVTNAEGVFEECSAWIIYTPCNLRISVLLSDDYIWKKPDGTKIAELPQDLDYSIMIMADWIEAPDEDTGGSFGDVRWFINEEGHLNVQGKGEFSDTEEISRAPWYDYRMEIKTATINITGIIDVSYMFYDCNNLTEVDLSKLDASNIIDATDMFSDCSSLFIINTPINLTQSVLLPESSGKKWYLPSGKELTELPQNMKYSIVIEKKLEDSNVSDPEEEFIAKGSYGELIWSIDKKGKLTVKGVGEFTDQEGNNRAPWYDYRAEIISADIDVTDITDTSYMFYDCSKLYSVDFSGFDTGKVINMSHMFSGCSKLYTGFFSFDTSNVTDMSYMFLGCRSPIGGLNTCNTTNMEGMFSGCWGVSGYYLKNFDTRKVTNMSYMFSDCNREDQLNLNIDLSGFDTSNVTNMEGMFSGSVRLGFLDLSSFDTGNVTNMANMFQGCTWMSGVDLSNFDTEKVINMDNMFSGCNGLKSVDLSNFNMNNVLSAIDMFASCDNLKIIYTPPHLEKQVQVPTHSWRNIKWYQLDKTQITELPQNSDNFVVVVSEDISKSLKSGSYEDIIWFMDVYGNLVVRGEGEISDKEGMDRAPWYDIRADIKTAEVKITGITDASYMFYGCENMTSIDLKCLDTANVVDMEGMFSGLKNIQTLDLRGFDTTNVANMNSMFDGCELLDNCYLNGLATGKVTDMENMFRNCRSLTGLALNFNMFNVTSMKSMFSGCTQMRQISLSNTSNVENMESVFKNCKSLSNLNLNSFNTENVTNMHTMFENCSKLTSLDLSNFDMRNVTDATDMIQGCTALNMINTPVNLNQQIVLPSDRVWFQFGKLSVTELPQNLNYSVVIAGEGKIANGDGNEDMLWFIDGDGKLIVRGKGEITEKEGTGRAPWYDNRNNIKTAIVYINDITDISYMFEDCINLTSLDLSQLDASCVLSASEMFSGCEALKWINVPCNLTQSVALPVNSSYEKWYESEGEQSELYTELPQKLADSIILMKKGLVAQGSYGKISWYIDEAQNKLVVKGIGEFTDSEGIERAPWYEYRNRIKIAEVDIKDITNVSYMFYGCQYLESVDFSKFDTSKVTNMSYMFYNCRKCIFDLSCFDTSNVTNMSYMFYGCDNFDSADISNFDTGNVTNMAGMFSCISDDTDNYFIELDLSDFDTSNVTNMRSMFSFCQNLTNLNLSSFDTSKVTNMGGMFSGCQNLTNLNLSSFDTSKVTNMRSMFSGCQNLTNLNLSNFDTSKVTNMSYMFCEVSMDSLDLSNFDTGKVLNMTGMFADSEIQSLDLSGFDMLGVIYPDDMLCGEFGEADIDIIYTPRNLTEKVEVPGGGRWYQVDGKRITSLPQKLSYSIVIARNQIPSPNNAYIKAIKEKTAYECNDTLNVDDLTVKYYDKKGQVTEVTDFTTNADEIDMSTLGTKVLTVTYKDCSTKIKLTVGKKTTETEEVEVSGITIQDSTYTGRPVSFTGTAIVRTKDGTDVTEKLTLTYTYSGTMTDGSIYEDSESAPVNAGTYTLTVAVQQTDAEYTGSVTYPFEIAQVPVTVAAAEISIMAGDTIPEKHEYSVTGLLEGDSLIEEPSFIYTDKEGKEVSRDKLVLTEAGMYYIIPKDADAGMNYAVSYQRGALTIKENDKPDESDKNEKQSVTISGITIQDSIYTGNGISYTGSVQVKTEDGTDVTDQVSLTYTYQGSMADGSVFGISESAPSNAGTYILTVAVAQDNEDYTGNAEYPFEISKAQLVITASDITYDFENSGSLSDAYPYEVTGLVRDDSLTKEPSFIYTDMEGNEISRDNLNLAGPGSYYVIPMDADAGMNYMIDYQKGILTIEGKNSDNIPDEDDEVLPEDIPETGIPRNGIIWTSVVADQVYTGAAVKPVLRVYYDNKRLTEKTDYTLTYKNNKKPGTADIIITGKGDYSNKKTVQFRIVPKNISDKDVIVEDMAFADNGKPHKTAPNVVYNGKKLKLNTDFTIDYGEGDYTAAGEYYATITGKGNYTGTVDRVKTTVIDKSMLLGRAKITKIPNQNYNKGQEIILSDDILKVTLNGVLLEKDTDYTVTYINNSNKGKATVVVKGKGRYAGTKTAGFNIVRTPVDIRTADISCVYDKEVVFVKGGCMPEPKISYDNEVLEKGIDYTISYKRNKKAGTASFTVKGKGNFKGNRSFDFTIKQQELSAVAARVPDIVYKGKANQYRSKPVLTDTDGNVLKSGTDYTITGYQYDGVMLDKTGNPPEGAEITVLVQGKGSYTGTCSAVYQLKSGISMSKVKITIADQTYTGKAVKPAMDDITGASIKIKGVTDTLVYGRDYEIVSYGRNIKNGKGTIVFRGLGDYYGEKTVRFKITKKSVRTE